MKRHVALIVLFASILQICCAPPVSQQKKEEQQQEPDSDYGKIEDYMEYHRYLKEVVGALESDPEFRDKLENANETDIKSGKIAEDLQFVSRHVRNRLDEIKRIELQRLKDLTAQKMRLEHPNAIGDDPIHHHLDQTNVHTFEIEDLKKLIKKTTDDLAEADRIRKEEFKRYTMEKTYQKMQKLNHTKGLEREKLEKEYKTLEEKHKRHEKLHEPGHKAQLEEVWEEQDQMQQDFDPKTFFMLHDLDGNWLWDQEEVKTLFIKELDKMYQRGAPEDDMRERGEEMERMREAVFREMDTNKDGFIDYPEFYHQTNSPGFKQDHGWQGLDEQTKPYSQEELDEYIRQYHTSNQIPVYGGQHPEGGYQRVPPGHYQHVPQGDYQQANQQQFYPNQVPQMAPQHLDLNTNELHQGQGQYQQVPQANLPIDHQFQYVDAADNKPALVIHPVRGGRRPPNAANNPPQYQQPNTANNQQMPQQSNEANNPPQYRQPNTVNNQHIPQQPISPQYQQPNAVNNQQLRQQPNAANNPPQYQQPNAANNPPQYQQPNVNSQQIPQQPISADNFAQYQQPNAVNNQQLRQPPNAANSPQQYQQPNDVNNQQIPQQQYQQPNVAQNAPQQPNVAQHNQQFQQPPQYSTGQKS